MKQKKNEPNIPSGKLASLKQHGFYSCIWNSRRSLKPKGSTEVLLHSTDPSEVWHNVTLQFSDAICDIQRQDSVFKMDRN